MKDNIVQEAFDSLTTKQREVWVYIMRKSLSEYETAKLLDLTRDCVHDRITKARRRFQKFLEASK